MKSFALAALVALIPLLPSQILADDAPAKPFPKETYSFTTEVQDFIEKAKELREMNLGELTQDQNTRYEAEFKNLQQHASNAAWAYFAAAEESNRADYIKFLETTMTSSENKGLKTYFLLLGNAFAAEASKVMEARQARMKKILIGSAIGGAVLGVAGATVFYRMSAIGGEETNRLLKSAVIAIGITAVVAGGGYAVRFILPADQAVSNATDFQAKYPHGEDFINDLTSGASDLAFGMKLLEEGDEGDDL